MQPFERGMNERESEISVCDQCQRFAKRVAKLERKNKEINQEIIFMQTEIEIQIEQLRNLERENQMLRNSLKCLMNNE
jgi:predicted RNase H-like nuclease (RuvC/YqgF family)